MGARHSCGDHAARKRFCQYCSNRPLRRFAKRARMALAPRRVQNVPGGLSRDPMMVLHPASITPETMKRCCFLKMGQRMRRRCAKSIPLRCGSAGSAGRPDSVRDIERVTGASQFHFGLARSRGRGREAQQFADGIEIRANSRLVRAFVGMARSQSKSRGSTISLPSGSRTACSGVRSPRTGIFW